jgi:hypothetical protein
VACVEGERDERGRRRHLSSVTPPSVARMAVLTPKVTSQSTIGTRAEADALINSLPHGLHASDCASSHRRTVPRSLNQARRCRFITSKEGLRHQTSDKTGGREWRREATHSDVGVARVLNEGQTPAGG